MSHQWNALSNELTGVVREIAGSVVAVNGGHRFPSSGIVLRPGVVVTAEHVVRAEDELSVAVEGAGTVPARLVGRDPGSDIAVLAVEPPQALTPAAKRAAAPVEPGELVLSVGRSANAGPVASMGIIGAVSGPWRTWRGGRLDQYIRLDLGMYPGSSGAAVVDASGGLIGMATSALSRVAGLAVPASVLDRVTDELLKTGHVSRAYLGVALQPVAIPEYQLEGGVRGLLIVTVEPGSPAATAGLLVGDILLTVNGTPVHDTEDVQNSLEGPSAGGVSLKLLRGGSRLEVAATPVPRPSKGR